MVSIFDCRWEPEPGETGFTRRPSKWDSQETDLSADAYQHNAHRDTGLCNSCCVHPCLSFEAPVLTHLIFASI